MDALRKIVLDPRWIQSLRYYIRFRFVTFTLLHHNDNFRHTGMLESFHSLLLSYCPKRVAFK